MIRGLNCVGSSTPGVLIMNDFEYEDAAMPYFPESSNETSSAVEQVKQSHERELMAIEGVEGVGIGRDSIGNDAIIVYLRVADARDRVPGSIGGFPVETRVTGIIDAY
jgi:hypothetical protein